MTEEQPESSGYRGLSYWLDDYPGSLAARPSLPGDHECDVAIIGAGFTGLWTAYYLKLQSPDARVTVLEKEIAGFGPSGRNGGWVQGGMAGTTAAFGLKGHPELAERAVAITNEAVDEIGRVTNQESIECGYRKAGCLAIATSEPQRQRQLARLASDDDLLDPERAEKYVNAAGVRSAVFSPHAARVNPGNLVRGLADACERLGVRIFERSPAIQISPGRVRCEAGEVRAQHVVRATESYTTQAKGQSRRFLPLYSLMVATEPLPEEVWDELGWDDGLLICDNSHLFFYAQRTPSGRLAIGGRGSPYRIQNPIDPDNERNESVRKRLQETIARTFPAAADARITHHWGGPLAVPRDWSMSVNLDRQTGLGWAGGYTGHGVGASNISGRTMADLILGRSSELTGMPWVGHRTRNWEPEPLRFLASRAIVTLLGRADRSEGRTGKPSWLTKPIRPFLADS